MSYRSFKGRSYAGAPASRGRYSGSKRYPPPTRPRVYRKSMLMAAKFGSQRLGSPKKACDIPVATYTLNSTPQFTTLNIINNGAQDHNRLGDSVKNKSLYMTGFIRPLRTIAASDYVRIMVIYDRQPNGAIPTIGSVLASVDNSGAITSTATDHTNISKRSRYQVLCDIRQPLYAQTVTAGVLTNNAYNAPLDSINISKYLKLHGLVTEYEGSAGTVADITTGSLHLLTLGTVAAASEGYELRASFRLRFDE